MGAQNQQSDVIVIGGGPAGAAVATWMAHAGFEVLLLDRARFPRDKACGEFLTPQAKRLLADLGVWTTLRAAGALDVNATVLATSGGRQMRHAHEDSQPIGYACRRVTLDNIMLRNASSSGVQVREGFTVRHLLRNEQGAICGVRGQCDHGETLEIHARMVIGADGAHSLVARQLGLVRALPRLQRIAIISHWRQVAPPHDTIEMRAQGQTICGLGFPGAADHAPYDRADSSPSANLTLVVPTHMSSQIAGRAGDFVEETLQNSFPDLVERFRGAVRETAVRTVGCFGHRCRPAIAAGALLVGDAASFIDPFTGEGVYFALEGAQRATETAVAALHAGDVSLRALQPYQRARRELAQRYQLCDAVQAIVRTPALFRLAVQRLDRFPMLADRLFAILGDARPPTDVLHPGFLWRLLAPEL